MKATAIALAVTLGLAAGAANATSNLGTLSMGDNYFNNNITGSFEDFFTFTTPSASSLGADAIANFSVTGFNANITETELLTTAQAAADDDMNFLATSSNTGVYAALSYKNLPAGTYVLEVEGYGTGGTNGMTGGYHADINLSPVPEASEWAMMASGLGLFGFIASRRSKKAA